MKIISLTITVDQHLSWWLEIVRTSDTSIKAAVDSNQVLQTRHLVSDRLLMLSTVKGSTNYAGDDMKQLHEAALNVLKTRIPG
jgi:hypothetical protein